MSSACVCPLVGGCCGWLSSHRAKCGLVMALSGCTAVNITDFYYTVYYCNEGQSVAPRCLSGFDCVPEQPVQCSAHYCLWRRERWSLEISFSSVVMNFVYKAATVTTQIKYTCLINTSKQKPIKMKDNASNLLLYIATKPVKFTHIVWFPWHEIKNKLFWDFELLLCTQQNICSIDS